MNNINELYTQLSTSMPERKKPVRSLKEGVGSQEIPDISDEEAGNILDNVMKFGLQMLSGSDIAREIGASKLEPTISEDIQEGRIGDAALKGVGTASDVALAASPFLGPAGLVVGPAALGVKTATKVLKSKLPKQEFTSAKTSRPQIAAIFKDKNFDIKPGEINIDIGGGKFDKGSDYIKKNKKATNLVYDIFNRSKEHNDEVLNTISKKPADTATVANVLNVIKEPEIRKSIIEEAKNFTKKDGKAFFITYEKKGTGIGEMTKDGFQTNMKTKDYLPEIENVFGKGNVELKGKTIIATKGTPDLKTKAGSVVKRGSNKYSVGKVMGNDIYFHKDYINDMPKEVQAAYINSINKLPENFNFKTIKYNDKDKSIRFDEAPNFDTAREPIPGNTITVKKDGSVGEPRNVTQILHHKWQWVKDNYPGFNVKKEYNWSKDWLEKGVKATGSRRIWEENLKKAKLPIERN